MKPEEVAELIRYRLEQASTSLEDAKFLLTGNRSPQSIINRSYYAMFYKVIKSVTRERAEEILQKAEHFLEVVKTYLLGES